MSRGQNGKNLEEFESLQAGLQALHPYVDIVLFQVADEQVCDADINGEGHKHPPQRRIVRSESVNSAVDNLVQNVSCQGVLTKRAKEANLPVS